MTETNPLPEDILLKIRQFCAYRERSHKEVRSKLLSMKVYGDLLEQVINHLIQHDFLNEERFARTFARSKFKLNKWGRNKIRQELRSRSVSDYCLRAAMEEIDEDDYRKLLREEIRRKYSTMRPESKVQTLRKVSSHFIVKGFEPDIVYALVKEEIG